MAEVDSALGTWLVRLQPYRAADDRRAVGELLITLIPLGICLWGLWVSQGHGWVARIIATVPAAGLMMRLFMIQHDCGHGSFFSSRRANDLVGGGLGVLTLAPYAYWRRTHRHHHANHGRLGRSQLGGLETWTVRQYRARSRLRRLFYRLYRNPFVLLLLGPPYQLLIKHRLPFDAPLEWRREWISVGVNDLAIIGVAMIVDRSVGLAAAIAFMAPVYMLMWSAGIWLFYVQHQFEGAYWKPPGEWRLVDSALQGSSHFELPGLLRWMTGNIGYHHIHHLSVEIPMYRLADCHRNIPELSVAPRFDFMQSVKLWRLALWDGQRGRLVGFAAADAGGRA